MVGDFGEQGIAGEPVSMVTTISKMLAYRTAVIYILYRCLESTFYFGSHYFQTLKGKRLSFVLLAFRMKLHLKKILTTLSITNKSNWL